jgi:hypothetical protein
MALLDKLGADPLLRSALLVAGNIAVDQPGHIVGVLLDLFEESVVIGSFVFDFDVLVDTDVDRLFGGFGLVKRNEFGAGLSFDLFFVGSAGPRRPRQRHLLDRAAFWTDDRSLIEIEEFRAAVLALMLIAELGFRHGLTSERSPAPVCAAGTLDV